MIAFRCALAKTIEAGRDQGKEEQVRTKLSICRRKARYGCSEDAAAAAFRSALPLRPYRCDRCRLFHLTSRTKGKRIARPDAPRGLIPEARFAHNPCMQLTALLIPTVSNQLRALSGWLDKAEALASERGQSPDELLALRLAPDMFALTTQLRFLSFLAQEPVYRLRNGDVPEAVLQIRQEAVGAEASPGAWTDARARVADAAAFLASVGPNELDEAAGMPVVHELPNGMIFDMTGEQYVRDWALPQVAFHQMIVYALLRQAGVPLGKADYVPHMFRYLRPGTAPTA